MSGGVVFRRKKQNRLGMAVVFILVLIFCSVIAVKSSTLRSKQNEYEKRIDTLNAQIDEQNERKKSLEEYEKYTKTAKYVEEVAKEKLGLVYADEIVFESGVEEGSR